jgi:hypothetical protein
MHARFSWNDNVVVNQSTMVSVGKSQLSAQFGSHCHAYAMFVQYFRVDLNPVTRVVKNDQVLLYCDAG